MFHQLRFLCFLESCTSIKITPADIDTAQTNTHELILKNGPLFHLGGYRCLRGLRSLIFSIRATPISLFYVNKIGHFKIPNLQGVF